SAMAVAQAWGWRVPMSIPTSAMAATATGLSRSAGSEPAEKPAIRPVARWSSQPSAIWDRPALWMHRNTTVGTAGVGGMVAPSVGAGRGGGEGGRGGARGAAAGRGGGDGGGTEGGAIRVNVSVSARAMATAGLAKLVEEVNQ